MIRSPSGSTHTDTLFPDTTLFRSAGRRLAEAAMLVVGFAGLAGILVMLLLIERQYGLDTVLAADFTRGSLGNGADAVAQASREVLTALRDSALSRSEEHTSELQSLMRNSYAVSFLQKHTPT